MKTIIELVEEALNSEGLFTQTDVVLNNPKEAYKAIKDVLSNHGKDGCLFDLGSRRLIPLNRMPHIFVTYSIGRYIIKNIDFDKRGLSERELLQAWMVASLFHDVLYIRKINYSPSNIVKNISDFYLDGAFEPTYSKEEVQRYFNMKRYCFPEEKSDHGIAGAIYTYHALDKMFHKKAQTLHYDDNISAYVDTEKHITYSHRDLFLIKEACKAICQHNMFKPLNSIEAYRNRKFGLFEINNPNILVRKTDLINFILSIVDTIEIAKKIKNEDLQLLFESYNHVSINVSDKKIFIYYNNIGLLNNIIPNMTIYFNTVLDLKDWVDLKTFKNGYTIEIIV